MQPRPLPWVLLPMLGLAVMWWLGQLANVAAGRLYEDCGFRLAGVALTWRKVL